MKSAEEVYAECAPAQRATTASRTVMQGDVLLWQVRAEAWRRVACEYAAGRRKPYAVPRSGALRLRQECASIDWGAPSEESEWIATGHVRFLGMPPLDSGEASGGA